MTDRELLEAAARAVGIKALRDPHGVLRNCTGMHPEQNIFSAPYWNPLTDDGDALRLAVALAIDFKIRNASTWWDHQVSENHVEWRHEPHGDDPYAATRRAIVRAAAAMSALS